MKIKVKPEGRKNIWIPEKDSLKEFILSRKLKQIHNFIPTGMVVVINLIRVMMPVISVDVLIMTGIIPSPRKRR